MTSLNNVFTFLNNLLTPIYPLARSLPGQWSNDLLRVKAEGYLLVALTLSDRAVELTGLGDTKVSTATTVTTYIKLVCCNISYTSYARRTGERE